jgi:hypothetical protein
MRALLIAGILAVLAAPLEAQPLPSRASLSATVGVGSTYEDESGLGRGWLAGAAVDRVLFGSTRVELSLEALTHTRNEGYFQSDGRTVIGGVSLLHRFGRDNTQPYVLGGLTLGHHAATNVFDGVSRRLNSASAGYRAGGGIAFRAGERLEIAPEVRWNGFFAGRGDEPVWLPSFAVRIAWRM